MASNFFPLEHLASNYTVLEEFFSKFSKQIVLMNLNLKQKDQIIKLSSEMLTSMHEFQKSLVKQKTNTEKVFDNTFIFAIGKLNEIDTQIKRNKIMERSSSYVEPIEMSSGFKYTNVMDKDSGKIVRTTEQCTFQFVSLMKTLTSLFSKEEFERIYINYNSTHQCKDNIYERFCCGSVYQNSSFFKEYPMAIQVKIFVDDFEPCNALKSKAGKHKINAYYGQINIFPPEFSSKLSHIFLIALCDSSDSKNVFANTDNVIETIKNDLRLLESNGIRTYSGKTLKGTLMSTIFDNLGGNILLGFNSSFNANYYCRICEASKSECQQMTKKCKELRRTIESYNRCVVNVTCNESNSNSLGVKSYCKLNDLEHFHTMLNIVVDPMHDFLEGAMSVLMKKILEFCVDSKIVSLKEIQLLVDCFDYGYIYKTNVPSKVQLDKKKNLGQNASQSYCLMIHLPFILFKFKEKLINVWKPVECLLRMFHIIKSVHITENDIQALEKLTQEHMELFKEQFNTHLRPKHHLILHYASVIRSMGPVIYLWVMRMEAKHQYFNRVAQNTKNFVNLKKTLAK